MMAWVVRRSRAVHAATRSRVFRPAFQAQGMSSARRRFGQPLTRRVSTSASQASGFTLCNLQVSISEASTAQFSAPRSWPAKSAFLRLSAMGRIERSTVLESISIRPSSYRSRPCENSGLNGRRADETVHLLKKSGYIACMQHIQGGDRNQSLLLPAAVDDYVGRENPVRFIEAFVDQCDLQAAGFRRVQPKDTGRPGYDPADLLKLYIYGYVNRVRSSRRLEAETTRNLEVIWLLRGLRPDFKTIADFRKDNRHAFKPVFRQFVLLCRKLDLFGRELLAVDGTRLKAVNSTDRNFTREKLVTMIRSADERLADYLSRLDRTDAEEDGASGRPAKNLTEKIAALKERKTRHEGLL